MLKRTAFVVFSGLLIAMTPVAFGGEPDLGDDAAAGYVEMLYNPGSGEVMFDVGSGIVLFAIEHQDLDLGAVTAWNGLNLTKTPGNPPSAALWVAGGLPEAEESIGLALPAGLDPAGLMYAYQLFGGTGVVVETGATSVPEPGTLGLLITGLLGMCFCASRRKR